MKSPSGACCRRSAWRPSHWGRWTPSPDERAAIAAALGVRVEEVSWGHSMNPRNIRYHRFGLKESF